jgi:hypothetical protein
LAAVGKRGHNGTSVLVSADAALAAVGKRGHNVAVSAASQRAKAAPLGTVEHIFAPSSGADAGTFVAWEVGWSPSSGAAGAGSVKFSISWRPSSGADAGSSAILRANWEADRETSMPTGDPDPRPLMPITVYFLTAKDHTDVAFVPANRWFVCSPYLGAGDDFADDGALPNWIGQRAVDEDGTVTYPLRPPYDKEVIWFVPENKLYRYETLETGEQRWMPYVGMPERGLDGQYFAQLYDPDAILAYWARVLGAAQWRLSQDNRDLLELGDPDLCPVRTIDALAGNVGIIFDFEDTIPARRARLRTAVTTYRRLGAPASVSISLRLAGYIGYAEEVWVEPDDPSNRLSSVTNTWGYPSSSAQGALLDDTKFSTLVRYRAHGEQHDPMEESPTERFYLTPRVIIHLNNLDGTPIPYASMSSDDIQTLHDRIFRLLRYDVLPAHVDIRGFGTDAAVGLCDGGTIPHDPSVEGVTVDETLTSVSGNGNGVAFVQMAAATMVATGTVT